MNDILLTPIRLNELELLIQNSVEKAFKRQLNENADPTESPDQHYTVEETAKYLGIKVSTVYTKKSKGQLQACKPPGTKRLVFFKSDLIAHLKQGRQKTNVELQSEADEYLTKKKG